MYIYIMLYHLYIISILYYRILSYLILYYIILYIHIVYLFISHLSTLPHLRRLIRLGLLGLVIVPGDAGCPYVSWICCGCFWISSMDFA
jgi:hypothetical protein